MKHKNLILTGIIAFLLAISAIAFRNTPSDDLNNPTCCKKLNKDCLQPDFKSNQSEIFMESLSRQIILHIPFTY
jgi:hypothetical protein